MQWRDSKLFVYGWLPVRLVASVVGHVALAVATAAIFLMWLEPGDAKEYWRRSY